MTKKDKTQFKRWKAELIKVATINKATNNLGRN